MGQKYKHMEFLIVDEAGEDPLIRVVLENEAENDVLDLRFVEAMPEPPDLMKREELCLVNIEEELVIRCTPLRQDRRRVSVRKSTASYLKFDRDLRGQVSFQSFIYPVSGSWTGRWEVHGIDLSCGGVAFSCRADLETGEQVELVLPVANQPLVAHCKILHRQPRDPEGYIYSAKFLDLCREEEAMIRRAVFDLQLKEKRQRPTEQETR